jgi:hypothetical protein
MMIPITHPSATGIDPGFTDAASLIPAATPGPRGSDLHPMRARYAIDGFCQELLPGRAVDAVVGEYVAFVGAHQNDPALVGAHWAITRAPEGSRIKLQAGAPRLVPDVAGLFVVTCTLPGGWARTILVAAFPPAALDMIGYLPRQQMEKRLRLRAILHDPNVKADSIVAGLEQGQTDLATLAGYTGKRRAAFSPRNYR